MSEIGNILNNNTNGVSPEKLTAYLEGRLPVEEQREVEMLLSEEGMESDAIDGLKGVDAAEIKNITEKINYRLRYDIRKQSHRSRKLFSDNKWAWLAVLMVIILCVLGYLVVKMAL